MLSLYPRVAKPVYRVHQVPEHFHEFYIIKGYRNPRSSALQCILSMFEANNETLNFWTHFLPCWYFLWVLRGLCHKLDFWNDPYTWPLLGYMLGSFIFPLVSAIAHLFNTMSEKARHVCFFVDYAGLSVFTYGVAVAHRAYIFPLALRQTIPIHLYLRLALVNAFACTVVCCHTRFMAPCIWKKIFRMLAFAGPYLYDCVPNIYFIFYPIAEDESSESQYYHCRQFAFALTSAFLYVTHLPERLQPGRFDIVGHSHQWFHVFSILATLDQMRGILMDMEQRREYITDHHDYPSAALCLGGTVLVVVINVFVVLYFSFKLYRNNDKMPLATAISAPIKPSEKSS